MFLMKAHDVYRDSTFINQTFCDERDFPFPVPPLFVPLELVMQCMLEFAFQGRCSLPFSGESEAEVTVTA
jgi:hypothetical protein